MTKPRILGKATYRTIGKSMGSEHLMDVELSAMITRAEKRIDDHLRHIQEKTADKAIQKAAKVLLAQMLTGLKRLETYRDTFR
jgi:hypothetical protein